MEKDALVPLPGQSNLTSQTGETVQIHFDGYYSGGTPGGGGVWDMEARNLTCTISVPSNRPLPEAYLWLVIVDELKAAGVLVRSGNSYSGTAVGQVYMRNAGHGLEHGVHQFHQFIPVGRQVLPSGSGSRGTALIDPINRTSSFQTDFYFASAFATTSDQRWPVDPF